ncbi:MAG: penicillin-binding protein 2 [Rhodospirillales bacterium]|nr:penicillin-binding protein 2 [Rhodospirillales bacterium]
MINRISNLFSDSAKGNMPNVAGGTPSAQRIRLQGIRKQALDTGRNRLLVTGVIFALGFLVIGARLVDLTVFEYGGEALLAATNPRQPAVSGRANIVDRNGIILATSLPTTSLFADPGRILDPAAAAEKLVKVMPGLKRAEIQKKLTGKGRFVWVARNLTPQQTFEINNLGIPGVGFQRGEHRVYPHGRAASHVLGLTDVDGRGIAGVEQHFDHALRSNYSPLVLSIDLRVQAMMASELAKATKEFRALGAAGLVMDVETGEMIAMVSLPDYDSNRPDSMQGESGFNRVAKGVYEMGSTFKLLTIATALDTGAAGMRSRFDASKPIEIASFSISDFHGKNRWLTLPEVLIYSSNIGAAKIAMKIGSDAQRNYLAQLGMLKKPAIEIPEIGTPLYPARWRDINTMTIAYGHGIAVTPVQMASAVATLVNGGMHMPVTILKYRGKKRPVGKQALSAETSRQMRTLMRLVVRRGTGKNADVEGYLVAGKTGTAEKMVNGRYQEDALISSFVGIFPADAPRYLVFALLDEPKGNKETFNFATGGWVAAPLVGQIIRRMAPLMGMPPSGEEMKRKPGHPLYVAAGEGKTAKRGRRVAAN